MKINSIILLFTSYTIESLFNSKYLLQEKLYKLDHSYNFIN